MVSVSVSQTLHLSLSQLPDLNSLRRCMEIVDPAHRLPVVERPTLRAVDCRPGAAPIASRASFHGAPAVVACAVGLSPKR
ncbi:MAG: hypothetical protein ACK418_14125 [Pseudomonas sp.]|uniref:hypothetical protein n=1 Tax=Pseudomonas sp. TaxID=306 RepID=UPI00391CFACE